MFDHISYLKAAHWQGSEPSASRFVLLLCVVGAKPWADEVFLFFFPYPTPAAARDLKHVRRVAQKSRRYACLVKLLRTGRTTAQCSSSQSCLCARLSLSLQLQHSIVSLSRSNPQNTPAARKLPTAAKMNGHSSDIYDGKPLRFQLRDRCASSA